MPWVHEYSAGDLAHVQNKGRTKNRHATNDGTGNGNGYWDDQQSVVAAMPFYMGWMDTGMGNPSVAAWLPPNSPNLPIPDTIYLCQTENCVDTTTGVPYQNVTTYDIYGNETYVSGGPSPGDSFEHVNYVYSEPYSYEQCVANCMGNLALVDLESDGIPPTVTITSVAWDGTFQSGQIHFCFGYQAADYPLVSLLPADSGGGIPTVGGGQQYLYIQPIGRGQTGVQVTINPNPSNVFPAPFAGGAMWGYSADWDYEITGCWDGWITCAKSAAVMTFPFPSVSYTLTPIGATIGTNYLAPGMTGTVPCNVQPPTAQFLPSDVQAICGGYGVIYFNYPATGVNAGAGAGAQKAGAGAINTGAGGGDQPL